MKLFNRWFHRAKAPMLDCGAVMRQLWDYLDGELTPERSEAIRQHVEKCSRCKPQTEFERTFLEAIARSRREHSRVEEMHTNLLTALHERGYSPR